MMEWDSVLKLGAFGACLMVAILVISYFVGVSYDSFWFSTVSYTHLTLPTTPYV